DRLVADPRRARSRLGELLTCAVLAITRRARLALVLHELALRIAGTWLGRRSARRDRVGEDGHPVEPRCCGAVQLVALARQIAEPHKAVLTLVVDLVP